jgi:S-adenosylmethionine decarboxylase
MKKNLNFGCHLCIDGYGGSFNRLNSKDTVRNALYELPKLLKMERITRPKVKYCAPRTLKDSGGYSGFVMIAESHISIHTFAKKGFLTADVYTCQSKLARTKIIAYFKHIFKLKNIEINYIKRGLSFPEQDLY